MVYKLLQRFDGLFHGQCYQHRVSTNGDKVAIELFEDLFNLGRSQNFKSRIVAGTRTVNTKNLVTGKPKRRGDGSFGELIPHLSPTIVSGFSVGRGDIANIEIGVETKILAKAMIKQIDRVLTDLENQARVFKARNPNAICVAVVGINQAQVYESFEGSRSFVTDGTASYRHPYQECAEAERRIRLNVPKSYDELIVLPFSATNQAPYSFSWINPSQTTNEYGAALIRISNEYDSRFPQSG